MLSLSRNGLGLGMATVKRTNAQMLRGGMASSFIRNVSSVKASHEEEQAVLINQRKHRPVSPHLQIYKPQVTWVLSGLHRITGVFMAAGLYGLTCGYAATSILNIPFDINSMIAAFGSLPLVVKIGAKASMAFPFAFHCFNGVRHLIWDFGKELTVKGVYRTGYVVLALGGVVGSYLTFM